MELNTELKKMSRIEKLLKKNNSLSSLNFDFYYLVIYINITLYI